MLTSPPPPPFCLWNVDACPFAAWCDRSRFSNRATVREGPSWITILIEREGKAAQLFQGSRLQCVSVHLLIGSSKKFTTVALRYLLKGIVVWYIQESISSSEYSLAILYACFSTRASYEERPRYRTQWICYWRRWYTVRTEWTMAFSQSFGDVFVRGLAYNSGVFRSYMW